MNTRKALAIVAMLAFSGSFMNSANAQSLRTSSPKKFSVTSSTFPELAHNQTFVRVKVRIRPAFRGVKCEAFAYDKNATGSQTIRVYFEGSDKTDRHGHAEFQVLPVNYWHTKAYPYFAIKAECTYKKFAATSK